MGISLQQWGGWLGIQHQHLLLCVIYIPIYNDYMQGGGGAGGYVTKVAFTMYHLDLELVKRRWLLSYLLLWGWGWWHQVLVKLVVNILSTFKSGNYFLL